MDQTPETFSGMKRDLMRVAQSLEKMGADKSELRHASERAGDVMAGAIRVTLMPHSRTGKLLSTVRVNKLTTGVAVTIGNKKVPYAAPINFGWLFVGPGHKKSDQAKRIKTGKPNIMPRRFMEKGIRNSRERTINIWLEELDKLLKKYERKANG